MRKKISVKLYALTIIVVGVLFVCFSGAIKKGISNGLEICASTLIPSLFPFLCLCSIAVGLPPSSGGRAARVFERTFRLPACCFRVLILSLVSGYPAGPMMSAELLEKGEIDTHQAKVLTLFCCCNGPSFSILAVGEGMCADKKLGYILFASSVCAQVLLGIAIGQFWRKKAECKVKPLYKEAVDFSALFCSGVEKSMYSMVNICAYVLVFCSLMELLRISALPEALKTPLSAVLEVTSGCLLYRDNPLVLAAVLGFGGFSMVLQVKKYLHKAGTSVFLFLGSRVLSALLSVGVCKLLLLAFPQAVPTLATGYRIRPTGFSAPLCAVLFLGFAAFILEDKRNAHLR